jgi:stage V sporulation protein B
VERKNAIHTYVYTSYVVQTLNVLVNFVFSVVIVRLLGADGFGDYSIFTNSLAFAILLLGFNLPSVLVFFITNQRIHPGKLLCSSLAVSLIMALLLVLLLYNSSSIGLATHVFPEGLNKPSWIWLFVVQFFLLQANQLFTAYLNAHKIFIPVSIATVVMNVLLVGFWVAKLFSPVPSILPLLDFIWVVNIIFNTFLALYFVFLILTKTRQSLTFKFISGADVKLMSGFALIVYACNTLQFLNYKMDIWFVHYYRSDAETGIYALALSLSQLIWILPNAISAVLLNYYEVNKREDSLRLSIRYGRVAIYLSLLTALLLIIIFYFAVPLLYGTQFKEAFKLSTLLFIGTVPFSIAVIIANLNSGIGFIRINLFATIFTFVFGFILDFSLIPGYGLMGATVAKIIVYIAGMLFHVVVAHFLYKLPWTEFFKWPDFRQLFRKDVLSN